MSHDLVAPSEYKAAYDKSTFPRSVFNRSADKDGGENREVRASIIRRIFLRPKEKKEVQPGLTSTPVVKVSIKRKAEPLQEIPLNDLKRAGKAKDLNASETDGGKLPNAIVNKVFKVLVLHV